MQVKFWGVRGSIATPGRHTASLGGNTSCVEVVQGNNRLILDAGTGIAKLGERLIADRSQTFHIFLSHFHFDHICGLPFFPPIYNHKSKICFYGPSGHHNSLKSTLKFLFTGDYFPVPFEKLPAQLTFRTLGEEKFRIGPFHLTSLRLNHPGHTMGLRVKAGGTTLVYLTDNEPLQGFRHLNNKMAAAYDKKLQSFIRGADMVIHDAHFLGPDYDKHRGWGHCAWEHAITLAQECDVKQLILFHFGPQYKDSLLLKQWRFLSKNLSVEKSPLKVELAREGESITIKP